MSDNFIPFSRPSLSDAAINEVVDCLQSGWITTGPRVKQFETQLKDYLRAPHALAVASATAGLHLALLALRLQPGDEVITSPLTFVASVNAIVLAGGKPVFADIDPHTFNIDPQKIKAAVTPHTKAIMPVHFAGLPTDLDPIYTIAEQHNLRVIEDAAHAIGAYYKDQPIGSFGDTQVFSFHPNKNITTGEGGCIATHDEDLATFASLIRFHGIDRDPANYNDKQQLNHHYDVALPGFKYNMMDIQAALGMHQLNRLDDFIDKRTELAESYQAILTQLPELTLPQAPKYNHKHAWHLYTPLLNLERTKLTRDQFIISMRECGIGVGVHFQAAHLYSFYRQRYDHKEGDFPIAEDISKRIVSLPLFPDLSVAQQDKTIETMINIFRSK